jgi:hypothetical protein
MHFSQRPTNFLMPSKKCFFERVATDAPLLSHHHHRMKIVFPLKLLSSPKRWKSDGANSGL